MKTTSITFLTLTLCAMAGSHAVAQDLKIQHGAIKGEVLSYTKTRNYQFCEFYVGAGPVAPSTELEGYNSTATSTGCPSATFAKIDPRSSPLTSAVPLRF